MINKNLIKVFFELSKLNKKNFDFVSSLDKFQLKIINYLIKHKSVKNKIIFENIKSSFSRAEKYRSYKDLLEKKIIYKKKLTTFLR